MPLLTTCPQCRQKLKIGDDAIGKNIKCPGCATVFAAKAGAPTQSQEQSGEKPQRAAVAQCTCPSCRTTLKLAAPMPTGKQIKCPKCATVFPVQGGEVPIRAASSTAAPAGDKGVSPRDENKAAPTPRRRAVPDEEIADEADHDDDETEERAPRRRAGKTKQRKASRAFRVSALILGVIGGLFSGGVGVAWLAQASSPEVKAMREFAAAIAREANSKDLDENLARLDRMVRSSYFLLLAAPLGVAGGVLALLGRMKLGGALMLAAVPVPLILNVVTLMPLYFLLVGGLVALLTPSWPPGGGPSTAIMASLTAGGWVAIFVGWMVVILALPKSNPEVKTVSDQPAYGRRVEVAMGFEGYPDVEKRGVRAGQTIKVKGRLFVAEDGHVSMSLARLYEGSEPSVSAVELTRAADSEKATAKKKYQQPDGSTVVVGVVAELQPQRFSLTLEGAKD